MKKYLFFALAMVATCVLFNSCKGTGTTKSQPLVEWGFENTDKPGTIDHVKHGEFTYSYAFLAIVDEIEKDANWKAQEDLATDGLMARLTPATEDEIKAELTNIFETAIKNAEDVLKSKDYEEQPQKIAILAQYKFTSDAQLTTLKFYIPLYYTPKKD